MAKKRTWGTLNGVWVPHQTRDTVVDYVHYWKERAELPAKQILRWMKVSDELRKLARNRMSREPSDHTLQATALVHEAYLRLVGDEQSWKGRAHFFGAASEAMRRILVESVQEGYCQTRGWPSA